MASILPKVRLFVPCANVVLEAGKLTTIVSPYHTVRMPPGVKQFFEVGELWFYIQLSDAVGSFGLSVQLLNEGGFVVESTKPLPIAFRGGDQLHIREIKLVLRNALFSRPGVFEFRLMANHAMISEPGLAILRVLEG